MQRSGCHTCGRRLTILSLVVSVCLCFPVRFVGLRYHGKRWISRPKTLSIVWIPSDIVVEHWQFCRGYPRGSKVWQTSAILPGVSETNIGQTQALWKTWDISRIAALTCPNSRPYSLPVESFHLCWQKTGGQVLKSVDRLCQTKYCMSVLVDSSPNRVDKSGRQRVDIDTAEGALDKWTSPMQENRLWRAECLPLRESVAHP